jgi:hypothetical protein
MKKLTVVTACLLAGLLTGAKGATYEYPYLYKDPAIMGMGGAYTAVGGSINSLFYNPAGLSNIKREAGLEVTLLKTNVSLSSNVLDFINDLQDVLDIEDENEQLTAINNLVEKYLGENFHIDAQALTLGVSKAHEKTAWGFALTGSFQANFMTHQGAGTEGLIEAHTKLYAGALAGISHKFLDGKLKAGLGAKFFYLKSIDHTFTASEIVENSDNLSDYAKDKYLKDGTAFSFDVGLIYDINPDSFWNPEVAIAVLNVGDLDFGEAGKVPMSVNLGFSLRPKLKGIKGKFFKEPTIAVDVVDVTKNNGVDSDWGKRIRVGGEIKVWENKYTAFILRTGLYQGYPTFGTDLRLGVFNLQFATYAEEIGGYAGQEEDRRYVLSASVEW